MIPKTKNPTVLVDALGDDRQAFTIEGNGKAFRVLIDGLYSDKIGAAVREIITNAYDAHRDADKADEPIQITVPTPLDPVFRVRDFGPSMTHDQVMHLYSTLFASSKEQTNNQVGMFGLGSKSPFAYTNSFSVTAIQDGVKRTYVAHVDDDDVPQITRVSTEDALESEPTGVEVSVPVNPADCSEFADKIRLMVLASDTPPVVDGDLPDFHDMVLQQGDGWRVITTNDYGRAAIRQGCVIYPVRYQPDVLQWGSYCLVVDVPIGAVEVTASRESLQMNEETTRVVNEAMRAAEDKIHNLVAEVNDSFANRLEAFEAYGKFSEWCTRTVGHQYIDLHPDSARPDLVGQSVSLFTSKRKRTPVHRFNHPLRDTLRLLVEHEGDDTVRRSVRLGDLYTSLNQHGCSLATCSAEAFPRIARVLGLEPDQILRWSDVPDPGPATKTTGAKAAKLKTFPAGKYWLPKTGAKTLGYNVAGIYIRTTDHLFNSRTASTFSGHSASGIGTLLAKVGVQDGDVLFLTEAQASDIGAPKDRDLRKRLPDLVQRKMNASDVKAYQQAELNHGRLAHMVSISRRHSEWYTVPDDFNTILTNRFRDEAKALLAPAEALKDKYQATLSKVSFSDRFLYQAAAAVLFPDMGPEDLTKYDVTDKIEALKRRYANIAAQLDVLQLVSDAIDAIDNNNT